ncbi:alpha/beta fold hydrolase [Thermaerobacter sp. PB12/4term]|uniref:alpha/beta fold hydrolase n=1 Tax=Thermaerobacter sp. PB12/4term TaxID=2293838 RepID=UPI001FAD0C80|nr:alpha/beta fold hydrolase [Thermaerobacter sp. PB12/4term]
MPGLAPALFALTVSPPLFGWQMRTLFGLSDEARIAEYRAAYVSRQCRRAVARAVAAWAPVLPPVAGRLRLLRCPVLLLWGMRDRWIFPWKPFGECFLRDLPRARVVKLHRAGHFLQLEAPAEVAHHVADFVTACAARM